MSLRIRQVKPDYWRDDVCATLTDTERLVYIGLWMEADDTGWFRESAVSIAADLFPFLPRSSRERKVAGALDTLRSLGRIVSHPCGHTYIPHLTTHQRLSAPEKQVKTTLREHEKCASTVTPAGTRGELQGPLHTPDTEREGKGNGRGKGTVESGRTGPSALGEGRAVPIGGNAR